MMDGPLALQTVKRALQDAKIEAFIVYFPLQVGGYFRYNIPCLALFDGWKLLYFLDDRIIARDLKKGFGVTSTFHYNDDFMTRVMEFCHGRNIS